MSSSRHWLFWDPFAIIIHIYIGRVRCYYGYRISKAFSHRQFVSINTISWSQVSGDENKIYVRSNVVFSETRRLSILHPVCFFSFVLFFTWIFTRRLGDTRRNTPSQHTHRTLLSISAYLQPRNKIRFKVNKYTAVNEMHA